MQSNIEKQILLETKGLPENALDEVLHFIQFLKSKWSIKDSAVAEDNLSYELSRMDNVEWAHLESEVKDYKTLFPHVK